MTFLRNIAAFLLITISATTWAQVADIEGSQDHPMFTRMSNFYIGEYETNYDRVEMYNPDGSELYLEGDKTYIYYYFDENSGKKNPSTFQILKNYENAIKRIGGRLVHTDNGAISVFTVKKDGRETWVKVHAVNSGFVYYLTIVELAPLDQEITANALFTKLESEGSVSLYINFDTGKSNIQAESEGIIEEVAKMLKENADLNISIEGHTDNVGSPALNKSLSLSRAKAVMTALTAKGIASNRLKIQGWGQEKPIADNSTEEGRSQNRRVEIVKF